MMTLMIFVGVVAMCGSVIDGVIIGNCLPSECMTAFGYASPVFIFLAAVGGVFANGGKAQCAVLTGKGHYEEARENFTGAFLMSVAAGILIMIVCLLSAESLAAFMGAEGALISLTAEYIRGLATGAVPILYKYRVQNRWDMWAAINTDLENAIIGNYEISVEGNPEAVMQATRKLRGFCESKNLDYRKSFRICLATEEIAGNIVEYKNKNTQYGITIIRGITEKAEYHYVASMNCLNLTIK